MSTLFAMSQVALFGREIRKPAATKGSERVESTSSAQHSSSTPMAAVGWGMPEPSATSAAQPAQSRWRINSLDMMLSAAASLGFDRGGGVSDPDEGSPPSRDELVEDEDLPTGLIGPSSSSRGSSPLYRKHDYSLEHTLDTTAPSSPCTPSMHNLTSLSAVSPTSTRSDEMAFHHQLSPQSGSHALAVSTGQATLASRPAAGQQGTVGGSNSGRFGLKLLVSNSMAGTLIGKGGTRICEIKEEVNYLVRSDEVVARGDVACSLTFLAPSRLSVHCTTVLLSVLVCTVQLLYWTCASTPHRSLYGFCAISFLRVLPPLLVFC